MRTRLGTRLCLALIVGWIGVADARVTAQVRGTAAIRVRVDVPPALAAGVASVTLLTPGSSSVRAAVLIDTALATFDDLLPGVYAIAVEIPGGARVQIDVRVALREIVTLEARLAPAGTASSVLDEIDRHADGDGEDFDGRRLQDLPSGNDLSALVETSAPFVIVDRMDTGGIGAGRPGFMGSRGASWTDTAVTFGAARLGNAGRFGVLTIAPDLAVVEAVAVTSGLAPIEIETPGVSLTLLPRRPGPAPHATVQASMTSSGMVGTNALAHAPSIARIESWRELAAVAGAPVGRRGGALIATSVTRVRFLERDRDPGVDAGSTSVFGHVIAQLTARDQVRFLGGGQALSRPFDGRAQFNDRNVEEQARVWHAQGTWERLALDGRRYAVSGSVQRSTFTPDVEASAAGGVVDRIFDGVIPGPASAVTSSLVELQGQLQPGDIRVGSTHHALRGGVVMRRTVASATIQALPVVAESVNGRAARVWQPLAPPQSSSRTVTDAAVYVGDRIAATRNFTIDAGVRFDLSSGSARDAAHGLSWRTVSPRLSARWKLGRLALFGGAGRYAARVDPFLLAYGDPGERTADVHRWHDFNQNRRFDPGESGILIARQGLGPAVAAIDPDARGPRTVEWTAGADLRLNARMTLRGALIGREETGLLGAINTGVPAESYRVLLVTDENTDWHSPNDDHLLAIHERRPDSFGRDAFVLTNPAGARASYEGIELTWTFNSARWATRFGATAYRARGWGGHLGFGVLENDQHVIGDRFGHPNAPADDPGRLFFDRAYVAKWTGSYQAPGGVRVGFAVRYQDGQPFSRIVIAEVSTGPEVVHAYAPGRTRFTYTATVDTRVEKALGRRAAIRLDVFNLTNHRNEVEEDVVGGPLFRLSSAVQPPRTARLGFRIDF